MGIRVKDYLNYFRKSQYPALFSKEDIDKLKNVERLYGDIETQETILEVCLSEEVTGCDYSIRKDVSSLQVTEYWYELDGKGCGEEDIPACYFIDASNVLTGKDNSEFYNNVLVKLTGRERVERLRDMLEICVAKLEGKCDRLFQLGSMNGRMELDRIRLFTEDMTREDIIIYLKELSWQGDTQKLDEFLAKWEDYSDKKKFILDFDILENGISKKIGINFGTTSKKSKVVKEFLEALENVSLCTRDKKEDVLKFINRFPSHTPFIQNDISHFKIPFMESKPLKAKAYLRQGSVCYCADFRAYDTPVIMNLELTTRCPLHCPQCYCELLGGKDMEFDTALYWLKEASKNNVKTINLSGGETIIYPDLEKLIKVSSDFGMETNIALSGFGVDKEKLERLIESGVSEICISLNGSTKEINKKTRDGYELAINTLQILKNMNYKKTYINWVMHSNNASDFKEMIKLAEKYNVCGLVVMVFKPDAKNQRKSVPSVVQIYEIAKCIKEYKGIVNIEVEECFSQLKAVLGKRFFTNLNQGISKGCGAGRDGISVSVDGKLTPCRHLEIKEDFDTIRQYWENSNVLKQIRQIEDNKKEPCNSCTYKNYCLPCVAVNWKMNKEIYMGEDGCAIGK